MSISFLLTAVFFVLAFLLMPVVVLSYLKISAKKRVKLILNEKDVREEIIASHFSQKSGVVLLKDRSCLILSGEKCYYGSVDKVVVDGIEESIFYSLTHHSLKHYYLVLNVGDDTFFIHQLFSANKLAKLSELFAIT